MLYELDKTDYGKVKPLFLPLEFQLAGLAVLDGMNPGKCFVDDLAAPRTAFMLSPEGCYLAGDPHNPDFNHGLRQAISSWKDVQAVDFALASPDWANTLADIFSPRIPIEIARRHYVCTDLAINWRDHVPKGFTVSRITRELLRRHGLKIPDHVYVWIQNNWGSKSWFLEHGFAFATLHGDKVVSWSVADCVSGSSCEIGIHTATKYRRRGLATVTAAATVDYALSHGFLSEVEHAAGLFRNGLTALV